MLYRNDWLCEGLTAHYVIVAAMRARTPSRSLTFGGSGGINVGSGCLDGPGVHRSADSTRSERSVDRRVKPTGAEGERVRTASRVPGRARPGRRTGVPCRRRRTVVNTPSQSEGEHLTGGQAPTQSQDRRVDGERWYSRAILSDRGEGQSRADSQHTGSCQEESGEPPERACELGGAAHKLRALSREAAISSVGDGYLVDERVRDKHVCRRRRRMECERLGVSSVSLMS